MKKILRIFAAFLVLSVSFTSCNEKEFLEEEPLSIYTASNALASYSDFHSAVNYMHYYWGTWVYNMISEGVLALSYGTDLAFCSCDPGRLNKIQDNLVPSADYSSDIWTKMYVIITQANFILNRLETNETLTTDERNEIRGNALFFRAFGYRVLANLFGGVPLIEDEVTAPHKDYVRATREETYKFCQTDLTEAATLLPDIENVKDGEINKQVAQHLLSEIDICLGDYDGAITAAKAVINHPTMALMTKRFGGFQDQEGSAYSDLFKYHNINRSSGNTETLWANQYEFEPTGMWADMRVFKFLPNLTSISINYEGVSKPLLVYSELEYGGAGRAWMQPTTHVTDEIWENDEGDLRNAPYLIVRDYVCDNPDSPAFGKWLVKDGLIDMNGNSTHRYRNFFPSFMKVWGGWVPDAYKLPIKTAFGNTWVLVLAWSSFCDTYNFRLAETYLLLAEAYLDKGDKEHAAEAINVVRARSEAPLAKASEIDIDYILDERLRELTFEELRMLTLCRLGKLADRTRRYNKTYLGNDGTQWESTGTSIQDYHNLWPIPYSEIERNTEAVLEQNPGYSN